MSDINDIVSDIMSDTNYMSDTNDIMNDTNDIMSDTNNILSDVISDIVQLSRWLPVCSSHITQGVIKQTRYI